MDNKKPFVIATAIVTVVIIYGSLYPFNFRPPVEGLKPAVRALVDSWADAPSRSDFIANILVYMPFGFCATGALRTGAGAALRIVAVTLTWVRGPGAHAAGVATDNPLNSLVFGIDRSAKHSKTIDTRLFQ